MFNKPLFVIAASLFALNAYAGNQDKLNDSAESEDVEVSQSYNPNFSHFVLSADVGTANQKITDTALKDWRFNEAFSLQYAFNPYLFAGASVDLFNHYNFGYKLDAGFELPTSYLTPYVVFTYNNAHSNENGYHVKTDSVDYSVGTTVTAPWLHNVSFLAELKDLVKKNESARLGVGYNFTKNTSMGLSYSMALNNKSNGLDLEMDYAFN